MPFTDMPLAQLRTFNPTVREPEDFDAFWRETLAEARTAANLSGATAIRLPADTPITELIVEDLTFPGFGADPVKAWVLRPKGREGERLPVVVEYNGYNGGRGIVGERVLWALSGYVHVFMDTRGQGSGWGTGGETADPHGSNAAVSGWMTRGILDPRDHYYRRVYTDAARLIDEVRTWDFVDPTRIAVTGGSQGGGIAIAAAGLSPDVWALMPDVAFLCAWEHGANVAMSDPFQELSRYLAAHRNDVETVWNTASYFDGVNFTTRITAPALFSVALMDQTVPPSTTFAAFNRLASEDKTIEVYAYNGHEGGQTYQWLKQAEFLAQRR
ncbi:acetylxylan esterase [Gryllotalpicola protaetiae]|uniref:Acetylxylan esterase n=1 Tax=Gryllotalpicola protaetiae TaxID=2419771 RepID=A0A387BJT9_9MICO|nr:acetylxylan esterase [Gryllotalpicola protaetiae]AYG04113.1 acetylxylan esterase [Gryllotalpicola protaetiae]